MSDDNRRMKVSREGMVLIKSFEGFRPRAERLDDGRWVIGYGHTASAREGATVGEQDAELLLQYDLMPAVNALNDQVAQPLNQHQFDALASFAVSVGVERFLASDVLHRVNAGHPAEAAEALVRWPDADLPSAALRRRNAERALFVADPDAPVRLSDLLAAPLETSPEVSAIEAPFIETTQVETTEAPPPLLADVQPSLEDAPFPTVPVAVEAFDPSPVASWRAAVDTPVAEVTPTDAAQPSLTDAPFESVIETAADSPVDTYVTPVFTPTFQPAVPSEQPAFAPAPVSPFEAVAEPKPTLEPVWDQASALAPTPASEPTAEAEPSLVAEAVAETIETVAPVIEPDFGSGPFEAFQPPVIHDLPPFGTPETIVPAIEPEPTLEVAEPEVLAETPELSASPPAVDTDAFPALATAPDASSLTPVAQDDTGSLTLTPLVLTPPLETDFGPIQQRPVWTNNERGEGEDGDALPFDEPALSIVRHEIDPNDHKNHGWGQTASFLAMGGVGLVACGVAAAAFRVADTRGVPDSNIIGWAAAVTGLVCVGVSAWNLYVRWGRKG